MPRKIISCTACNARFDVAKYPVGSRVRCGRCSQVLTVPADEAVPDLGPAQSSRRPPSATRAGTAAASGLTGGRAASRGTGLGASQAAHGATEVPPPMRGDLAQRQSPPLTSAVTAAVADRDPLLGQTVNGVYRIVRKLGEGGYGAVYEARDVNLERRVAIKVMLQSRAANREYVAKFLREARTAAQLSHPNVVAVHGVGFDRDHNVHFLAMEYVEGRTFHDILQEKGVMPFEEAVEYVIQACRGLAAAHERNIIHRDIKPGNLMVTPGNAVKIADFGLAKIYDADAAQSTVIGTPYFMPPEQFEGKAKDGRTDIYALGVTFYYMLTLQRPHTGAGPAQILLSVMTKEPTSVLEHRPDLPEGIWPIVKRMIHRDLDTRYGNCLEIVRDLEQLLGEGGQDAEQLYCPACGVPNPVEATACSGCSESLLEKCPACGAEDAAGTKFCGDCGANIPLERAVIALTDEARQFLTAGRLARAREKLDQAAERSPGNLAVVELLRELDERRARRDVHRDAVRDLLARGRPQDALSRLERALGEFPESVEISELESDVKSALAAREAGSAAGGHAVENARQLETEGRVREALVAWRGVLVLAPEHEEARDGERRAAERVEQAERLLGEGTERLEAGDPETALERLLGANSVLPDDPIIQGRLSEAERLATELRTELDAVEKETDSRALPRLRSLGHRFQGSPTVAAALARAETAGHAETRAATRERLERALSSAADHEQAGRLRDAVAAFREATTLDPDHPAAAEGLARVQRRLAEFDALLANSRKLLQSGDPEGAERCAVDALECVPGDPGAEAQLARARTSLETMRHEAERIRGAIREEPDEDVLNWARDLASRFSASGLAAEVLRETEEACREAEEKAAEGRAGELLERGRKLEQQGHLPKAVDLYAEAARLQPENAAAVEALEDARARLSTAESRAADATRLLEEGDPEGARRAAEESLTIVPDQPGPAGTLAAARNALDELRRASDALRENASVDQAEAQLERATRLAAKYPRSARAKELADKAQAFLDGAKVRASEAEVRLHRDAARSHLEEGRLEPAVAEAKRALELSPTDADAQLLLTQIGERGGKARRALERARAAVAAGKLAEAVTEFDAALEHDPALGDARTERDAAAEAVAAARERVREALGAARSHTREHRLPEAIAAWEQVLLADPSHGEATERLAQLRARAATSDAAIARARESLAAGAPEAALEALHEARTAAPHADGLEELLAEARGAADELDRTLRELDRALLAEGELDEPAARAAELAERFPGTARAVELADRAARLAAERRRSLQVQSVRRLVREHRYGEACALADSLEAEGLANPELAAAAEQARRALEKVDGLRKRAAEARAAGLLDQALEACREILVALPEDAQAKAEIHDLDETMREYAVRLDAAESARRRGTLNHAIELYMEALQLNPSSSDLAHRVEEVRSEMSERHRLLSSCHDAIRRGDGNACADAARRILERHPDDDDARDLHTSGEALGRLVETLLAHAERHKRDGDPQSAVVALELVLRVAPEHERARELTSD